MQLSHKTFLALCHRYSLLTCTLRIFSNLESLLFVRFFYSSGDAHCVIANNHQVALSRTDLPLGKHIAWGPEISRGPQTAQKQIHKVCFDLKQFMFVLIHTLKNTSKCLIYHDHQASLKSKILYSINIFFILHFHIHHWLVFVWVMICAYWTQ